MTDGFTVWFTGLSGAGKSTTARLLARALAARGRAHELLDGDEVRTHLSAGLGFSRTDRDINVRRIGWVARMLNRHGIVAISAAISPYRAVRDEVRGAIGRFVEVFCDAPMDVLVERDPKDLYRRARAGEIRHFTGVDDPYEAPLRPDVHLRTDRATPDDGVAAILAACRARGLL